MSTFLTVQTTKYTHFGNAVLLTSPQGASNINITLRVLVTVQERPAIVQHGLMMPWDSSSPGSSPDQGMCHVFSTNIASSLCWFLNVLLSVSWPDSLL